MWAIITIDTFILRSTNDPYSSSSFDLILEQSDFQICPRKKKKRGRALRLEKQISAEYEGGGP